MPIIFLSGSDGLHTYRFFGVTTVNIAQDCGLKAQPASLGFKIVGLFLALMVAVLILQCRARVAEFIAGKSEEAELFYPFGNVSQLFGMY